MGKKDFETKRKLEKVLEHPKVAPYFDFNNTLMIDSESDKVRDYPMNAIVVPEYTLEEL